MVISICSFDAVIAVFYVTVRNHLYSISLSFFTAIISSFTAVSRVWYRVVHGISYRKCIKPRHHKPALWS